MLLLLARRKIQRLTCEKEKAEADLLAHVKARDVQEKAYGGAYEAPQLELELSAGDGYHQLHT